MNRLRDLPAASEHCVQILVRIVAALREHTLDLLAQDHADLLAGPYSVRSASGGPPFLCLTRASSRPTTDRVMRASTTT